VLFWREQRRTVQNGWQSPVLRVTFLDVGQGDSTVIEGPSANGKRGRVVVIDGGGTPGIQARTGSDPGTRTVVPFLRSRGISTVDLLVPTHPDEDHVGGLVSVAERLPIGAALDGNGYEIHGQSSYARLHRTLAQNRVQVRTARRGQIFDLGDGATLHILHPTDNPVQGTRSDDNNNSVVLRLVYKKAAFLLTGDAEEEAEQVLLAPGLDLSADVLKVGHHGSRHSTSETFLSRVAPRVALISSGKNNRFRHPHPELLARLQAAKTIVLRTDTHGAITVETDGEHFRFTTERNTR
jgi:competence protein ComEC